jgi:hypothetical protein
MASGLDEWSGMESGETLSLSEMRDYIVDCFTETHGPRFSQARAALGLDERHAAVRESVQGIVKLAYTIAGGSYDKPTLAATAKVVNMLAERSVAWGTPEDDVFENHCEAMRLLGRTYLRCTSHD